MWFCVAGPVPGGPEPERRAGWPASWLSQAVVQCTPLRETPEDSAGWAISAGPGHTRSPREPCYSSCCPARLAPSVQSQDVHTRSRTVFRSPARREHACAQAQLGRPAGADARPGVEGLGGRSPFLTVFSKEMNSECHLSDFF